MKKAKVRYTEGPIGKIKKVKDFLPKPEDLVLKEETIKVTISFTKSSIEFFKKQAEKNHSHYQSMIRALVDSYAAFYM